MSDKWCTSKCVYMTRILVKNSRPIDAFSPRFPYGISSKSMNIKSNIWVTENYVIFANNLSSEDCKRFEVKHVFNFKSQTSSTVYVYCLHHVGYSDSVFHINDYLGCICYVTYSWTKISILFSAKWHNKVYLSVILHNSWKTPTKVKLRF